MVTGGKIDMGWINWGTVARRLALVGFFEGSALALWLGAGVSGWIAFGMLVPVKILFIALFWKYYRKDFYRLRGAYRSLSYNKYLVEHAVDTDLSAKEMLKLNYAFQRKVGEMMADGILDRDTPFSDILAEVDRPFADQCTHPIQYGDITICAECDTRWDTNDAHPPRCAK